MKYYTEEHLWVEVVGETATIGISEFAAEQLNDVVGISLPDEADDIVVAEHLGEIDTGDDQLELIAPITGSVSQVNDLVLEEPDLILDSPEDRAWLCRLENIDQSELDDLMSEDDYARYVTEQ